MRKDKFFFNLIFLFKEICTIIESNLSEELDLPLADMPWHGQRDVLVDFASQLTALTGALGKMGQDLVLLAQSEIAEVQPGKGGGSSTMPHKSNPVQAEMLVTFARFNAGQLGTFSSQRLPARSGQLGTFSSKRPPARAGQPPPHHRQ